MMTDFRLIIQRKQAFRILKLLPGNFMMCLLPKRESLSVLVAMSWRMLLETTLNEQMNSFNQQKSDERKTAISLVQCKGV